MTREEIKKAMRDTKKEVVIKNLHELLSLVEDYPEYEDCISYAIEKLEQQPSEDCVSRRAVLDTKVLIELPDGQSFYCISPEDVEELPSVTPTRKKGKWIDGHCSECGCDVPAYIDDWKWIKDMDAKFCPKCGIEMEVEECTKTQ